MPITTYATLARGQRLHERAGEGSTTVTACNISGKVRGKEVCGGGGVWWGGGGGSGGGVR